MSSFSLAFASDNQYPKVICERILDRPPRRFGEAWAQVKMGSVAAARVLQNSNLANRQVEFLRIQLRGLRGDYWELSIYSGSDSDRANVYQRLARWSYNPQLFGIIDTEPGLVVGPRKLSELSKNLNNHPHLAKMIADYASFAVLHPPIENTRRIDFAPRFLNEKSLSKAKQKLSNIESELERRNLSGENLDFVASPDGELFLINPEVLHRGSKEQLHKEISKTLKMLEGLKP